MVALACGLVVLAYPTVVLGGRTFSTAWKAAGVNGVNAVPSDVDVPSDNIRLDTGASAWAFEPWAEVASRAWRDWDVPLWNPYQGMGTPLAANFQSAVFDPLLLPVRLNPTPLTWDIAFLLAFFLGAAATYLFLRQIGLERLPSLVGTAPFILSGFFFLYSNNHFFRAYLYLPALLLFAHRTVASPRLGNPVALGFIVAGNILIGMPEASFFVLGTLGLYSAYLIAFPPVPTARLGATARLGTAAFLGLALAAPLLLPALEYLPLSFSIHEKGSLVGTLTVPAGALLAWLTPYALGKPAPLQGSAFGEPRNWVGMASAVSIVAALSSGRPCRRYGGWFFALLGAIVLAKAYGFQPLDWIGRLPLIEQTVVPVFALPLVAFCAAPLVGIGMQSLLRCQLDVRAFGWVLATLLSGILVLIFAVNLEPFAERTLAEVAGWFGLAAVAGLVAFAAFIRGGTFGRTALAVAVLAELLVLAPRDFAVERVDPYVKPEWLRYVVQRTGPSQERVYATDAKLFPNTAGAYGLQDIRSLEALYPERYVNFIRHFIQPEFVDRFVGGPFASRERSRGETDWNPMFDLTGVRYVIAGGQQPGDSIVRQYFESESLHRYIRPHPDDDGIRLSAFDIGDGRRSIILVRSGSRARIAVPYGATTFAFSALLDPASPTRDGVLATAEIHGSRTTPSLWSSRLTPGVTPVRWEDVRIDLHGASAIDLAVSPLGEPTPNSVGFADLRFGFGSAPPPRQYQWVARSDGADVYENAQRLPRALVISDVASVKNENEALDYLRRRSRTLPSGALQVNRFDPSRQAVVEGLPEGRARSMQGCTEPGAATIRDYSHNRVTVDVAAPCPGILLLTDIFYPGWTATVNGASQRIYPTDIAFRGVPVESGRSVVTFRYSPQSFKLGAAVSAAAIAIVVTLGLLSHLGRCRRWRRRGPRVGPS